MSEEIKYAPYLNMQVALYYYVLHELKCPNLDSLMENNNNLNSVLSPILSSISFIDFYLRGNKYGKDEFNELAAVSIQFFDVNLMKDSHLFDFNKIKELTPYATDDEIINYMRLTENKKILKAIKDTYT